MSTLKITINSVCRANPQSGQLGGTTGKDEIQWQAGPNESYDLSLPGGVFDGYPDDFELTITGTEWQPATPLSLVNDPPATTISNYIYQNDDNCHQTTADDPPEVIIQS